MYEIRLRRAGRKLLASGEDLPVPPFSDPVLLVLAQRRPLQRSETVRVALPGTTRLVRSADTLLMLSSFSVQRAQLRVAQGLFFEVSRKSVGEALFVEFLQSLKVFNVAVIADFATKRGLAIDGGTIRYIALPEDAGSACRRCWERSTAVYRAAMHGQ